VVEQDGLTHARFAPHDQGLSLTRPYSRCELVKNGTLSLSVCQPGPTAT
jgi:hypothetical protein